MTFANIPTPPTFTRKTGIPNMWKNIKEAPIGEPLLIRRVVDTETGGFNYSVGTFVTDEERKTLTLRVGLGRTYLADHNEFIAINELDSPKPLKPHLDNALSVTSGADFQFDIHDALESYDKELADALDDEGINSNLGMTQIIKAGLEIKQGLDRHG